MAKYQEVEEKVQELANGNLLPIGNESCSVCNGFGIIPCFVGWAESQQDCPECEGLGYIKLS